MALSWIPRRTDKIYCAPACGHGCTWEAYERAVTEGTLLATRLGEGWEPRVWENLGWHYAAERGGLKVHAPSSRGSGYTAYLGQEGSPGGWYAAHGSTPHAALTEVMEQARERRNELILRVREAEKTLGLSDSLVAFMTD